jgi:hypothetical protein
VRGGSSVACWARWWWHRQGSSVFSFGVSGEGGGLFKRERQSSAALMEADGRVGLPKERPGGFPSFLAVRVVPRPHPQWGTRSARGPCVGARRLGAGDGFGLWRSGQDRQFWGFTQMHAMRPGVEDHTRCVVFRDCKIGTGLKTESTSFLGFIQN